MNFGEIKSRKMFRRIKKQKSDLIINLASKEYFTVLGKLSDEINVVSPSFKDYKNGKYKIISFYAKKRLGDLWPDG